MKDLRDSLDKNQQDYDSAVDSHMYNIDKMMGTFQRLQKLPANLGYLIHKVFMFAEFWKKRLTEVRDAYNVEKTKLLKSLTEERMKIQFYHEQSLQNLRNAMAKVENHFRDQAAESKADFAVREEEIRNKVIESLIRRSDQYKLLWKTLPI